MKLPDKREVGSSTLPRPIKSIHRSASAQAAAGFVLSPVAICLLRFSPSHGAHRRTTKADRGHLSRSQPLCARTAAMMRQGDGDSLAVAGEHHPGDSYPNSRVLRIVSRKRTRRRYRADVATGTMRCSYGVPSHMTNDCPGLVGSCGYPWSIPRVFKIISAGPVWMPGVPGTGAA